MTTSPCPHCPDGHRGPDRTPWGVYVAPERDSDGQPVYLRVQPSGGGHVAVEDADWLWRLIRDVGPARVEEPDKAGLVERCRVCNIEPTWTLTRRGDVATSWACPTHLSAVADWLQRDPEITELVVTHHVKELEWVEMFGNRKAL